MPHDAEELAELIAKHLREGANACPMGLSQAGANVSNNLAKYGAIAGKAAVTVVVAGGLAWAGAKLFGPF